MELVQNFLEPAYMLILFGIVEVLKYLGAFKALESFQFYEELNEDFSKDAKRLFILFIGIVLMLIF